MPTDLRSTLKDLALSYGCQIVEAVYKARLGELFEPAASQGLSLAERVSHRAASWAATYKLSHAEADLLRRAALGETQAEIARHRGTSAQTIEALKVRLLGRTRDASLERAANRLLRDVVEPSPGVAAASMRLPPVRDGHASRLEPRIEELRRLAAQPPSDAKRYAIGAIVKELKSHPEKYGDDAVRTAGAAVGEDQAGLYRFARVAERWSAREVKTLLALPGISWSHLVELSRVESPAVQKRLLSRIRREAVPMRDFHALVSRETK
ncbi:MAG TPA: hypothetical protein VF765_25415 [Polyangiaceae bacterium]